MAIERRTALTELIQQHVGTHRGGRMTVDAFVKKAIDPESGYSPSTGLVGKIIKGGSYTVGPELVGAIAVGLGIDRKVVAAAAHFQVLGYSTSELTSGPPAEVLRLLDAAPGAPEADVAARWEREERGD